MVEVGFTSGRAVGQCDGVVFVVVESPKSFKDVQQRIEFAVAVGLEREAQFLDKLKTQIGALEVEKTTAPD